MYVKILPDGHRFLSLLGNPLEVRTVPGNSQTAIEQTRFCFLFSNELPIFAIQNFVNMQISFIGLLRVF